MKTKSAAASNSLKPAEARVAYFVEKAKLAPNYSGLVLPLYADG